MEKIQEHRRIADLIVQETFGELSDEEQFELDAWLNESFQNRKTYQMIKNTVRFNSWEENYKKINVETGWSKVLPMLKRENRKKIIFSVLKYAAVFLIPLLVGTSLYYYLAENRGAKVSNNSQMAEIKPGMNKAVLITSDGKSIVLDSPDNKVIKEEDGILIQKTQGRLNYGQKTNYQLKSLIYNTIDIPRGGEYSLVLSDGTQVFLNSVSTFKYPVQFVGDIRNVELEGEAYFEVAKDPQKPFAIKVNGISLEVLGTSFNVNAYKETGKVITTLVEGKVRIHSDSDKKINVVLSPDDQAVYSSSTSQIEVNEVDVDLFTQWRNGQLIFYDERLEDIMTVLTRWYSAQVDYIDPSIKDLRFSGSLDRYGEIDQILDIIQSTNRVKIEIKKGIIFFSKKN